MIKYIILMFLLMFGANSALAKKFLSVRYCEPEREIEILESDGTTRRCKLIGRSGEVDPVMNWNETIVLMSASDFVATEDVLKCNSGGVQVSHIPKRAGFVVDVNLEKGIYLSFDPLYTPPLKFVALVAKLKGVEPIGVYPGMYSRRKTLKQMQREGGLDFFEDQPGRISPDGRYVSADGSMWCGDSEFPGVWDLETKKLVKDRTDCAPLFGLPAR